jgi:hypothetical protein
MNQEQIKTSAQRNVSSNPAPFQTASMEAARVEPCEFELLLQRAMEILRARAQMTASAGS